MYASAKWVYEASRIERVRSVRVNDSGGGEPDLCKARPRVCPSSPVLIKITLVLHCLAGSQVERARSDLEPVPSGKSCGSCTQANSVTWRTFPAVFSRPLRGAGVATATSIQQPPI